MGIEQRRGIASRVLIAPEDSGWDVDPATVRRFVVPLMDKAGYKGSQGTEEAPVFTGLSLPPGVVDMNREATGPMPCGLEFLFLGQLLYTGVFGVNGYLKPRGATAKLHQFFIPTVMGSGPKSFQVIRHFAESTPLYFRNPGSRVTSIDWQHATAGRVGYIVNLMGSGDEKKTDLTGGTTTDHGYSAASYFNHVMRVNGLTLVGLTSFSDVLDLQAARTDVSANDGKAGSITTGFFSAKGTLGTIFGVDGASVENNYYLYDLGENKTEIVVECIYSDLPPDICTQFFRKRYWVRLSKNSPEPGGVAGLIQEPTWTMVRSANNKFAAEAIGDNLGTFNIPASSNLGVKLNGGATITAPLVAGAARTVDQVVTDLNAHAPLTAVAVIDKFMGRVRITSKTTGAAGSVQIDTAVTGSRHVELGFDGTIILGKDNCPLLYELYNQLGAAYV